MKLVVDIDDHQALVDALCERLMAEGVVMKRPDRVEPYSVAEVAEAARVSKATVSRLAEAGVLKRVPHLAGRCLLTAESVETWMKGGDDE